MKKLLYLITLVTSVSFAQEGISYQAIAYDNNGFEMSSQEIQLQLSILGDSINGSAEYVETHTVTTDDFGLFSIVIGSGDTEANLSEVNWKSPKFLKVKMEWRRYDNLRSITVPICAILLLLSKISRYRAIKNLNVLVEWFLGYLYR